MKAYARPSGLDAMVGPARSHQGIGTTRPCKASRPMPIALGLSVRKQYNGGDQPLKGEKRLL